MKTTYLLTHLIPSVTYPAAALTAMIGVLDASILSFPGFIGLYTASGILAIAFRDYARPSSRGRRAAYPVSPAKTEVASEPAVPMPAWHVRTLSA